MTGRFIRANIWVGQRVWSYPAMETCTHCNRATCGCSDRSYLNGCAVGTVSYPTGRKVLLCNGVER